MSYEEDHGYEVFGQNLWIAATERERQTPVLKNDRERREFVQNSDNWKIIGKMNGIVMERMLEYKGNEWYSLEILQNFQRYNSVKRELEYRPEWNRIGIWALDKDVRAFTYGWSVSQIVEKIKEVDRKEKQK